MTKPLTLHAHEVRRLQDAGIVAVWRPVTPQPEFDADGGWVRTPLGREMRTGIFRWPDEWWMDNPPGTMLARCPHGAPGETRFVREVWRIIPQHSDYVLEYAADPQLQRRSVHPDTADHASMTGKWRSPVTMPRWASRATATVTGVVVKRTEQLDEDDALAAGCVRAGDKSASYCQYEDWERRYHVDYCWDRGTWAWGIAITLDKE